MGISRHLGRPEGLTGRLMMAGMNQKYAPVSRWGLSHLQLRSDMRVLDVGCGGGGNLKRLAALCPAGQVTGIDISVDCVKRSQQVVAGNRRCEVQLASVENIPCPADSFDAVTAVEAHYYWPCAYRALREIRRVLRPGGTAMAACCHSDPEGLFGRLGSALQVCTPAKLEETFLQAGFTDVTVDTTHGSWVCVTGKKPAPAC